MTEHVPELFSRLGRLEGKLDLVLSHQKAHAGAMDRTLRDLSTRTRSLERWRAWTHGVTAAIAAGVSFVITAFNIGGQS